jgi:N-acetylmuramoyl-L-alanine amidase
MSFAANRAYPLKTGIATTWTATATGGAAALQYQFWRYSAASGAWSQVTDWSGSGGYTWTPNAPGTYVLQVWVRQSGTAARYDTAASSGAFLVTGAATTPAPVTMTSLTASTTFPKPTGTIVTWTAFATGGSASLEYQYWLHDGRAWSVVRAYAPGNVFAWTPTVAGTYYLQAWVRQIGTTASYEAYRSTGALTITSSTAASPAPVSTVALTASRSFPAPAGSTITWTGTADGDSPEYQFWLHDGTSWTIARPYAASRTFAWTPQAAGTYVLQVWARSAGTVSSYQAAASSGGVVIVR